MNRIKLLSEQVANQIAAGEVVERPASVVKELVENALDAAAGKIVVEIGAGGRSLIRVTDDGTGMSRDDALLSLERHATSKIRRAEDLASIATMGFRGEALPSIASVSRFTLTTREREGGGASAVGSEGGDRLEADLQPVEGTQIVVNGGTIAEVKAAGSATGTCIEVRQLFYNLPARRKFLRAEETEAAHIQHYLTLAALAFPAVAFTFLKDTRPVWQLPPQKSGVAISSRIEALRERFRALLGDEKLLPVSFAASLDEPPALPDETDIFETASPVKPESGTPDSELRIWGLIGSPGVSRATRDGQFTYVNRRPVENRGLNYALIEGYHNSLMKGRYPVCCLFLELNPAAVDVNIHPAKREVKFHREFEIRKFAAQAVREALLAFHAEPARAGAGGAQPRRFEQPEIIPPGLAPAAAPQFSSPALPQFPETLKPTAGPPTFPAQQSPLRLGFSPRQSVAATGAAQPPATIPATEPSSIPHPPPSLVPAARSSESAMGNPQPAAAPLSAQPGPAIAPPSSAIPAGSERSLSGRPPQLPVPLLEVPLRLVGVVGKLYVVLESDRGLVLLDQHAAHERILFEQMMSRIESNTAAPSQKLLLPETVELPPRDAQFLREQLPALTRLGVGLNEFGERTFLLDALPPFVKAPDARRFVLDLVDELRAAGREVNLARLGEHTVAKTVCRHAVKANDPLGGPELENLVEDLRRCAMPYTCPHGRPTLIEMNYRELEKKFGRTQ